MFLVTVLVAAGGFEVMTLVMVFVVEHEVDVVAARSPRFWSRTSNTKGKLTHDIMILQISDTKLC